jgi:hypothetical protein
VGKVNGKPAKRIHRISRSEELLKADQIIELEMICIKRVAEASAFAELQKSRLI